MANPPPLTPVAGEKNVLSYIPLGVGVIIPPWNFAFAIMAGMTSAAIVAGNTAILKPSSARRARDRGPVFVDLTCTKRGCLQASSDFIPVSGRAIGDALVDAPQNALHRVYREQRSRLAYPDELASKTQAGQIWVKRVVAEMGGKDAIVVADDADLDAAADGVIASAFGFQGQKCSACSRAIVDANVYDDFLARLTERAEKIVVGDPTDERTYRWGKVINEKAMRSIISPTSQRGVAEEEGRLFTGGKRTTGDEGFFVEPTIIADVEAEATIAREEIFGPVLAVIKAKDHRRCARDRK